MNEITNNSPITPPVVLPPQPSVPPTTTHQEDITFEAQRNINLIWEKTQSRVALGVVFFTCFVDGAASLILIMTHQDITVGQTFGLSFLNLITGIVISFYFSRTNHAAIGGIGPKPTDNQQYLGR